MAVSSALVTNDQSVIPAVLATTSVLIPRPARASSHRWFCSPSMCRAACRSTGSSRYGSSGKVGIRLSTIPALRAAAARSPSSPRAWATSSR